MHQLYRFSLRKHSVDCAATELSVVKTIRLHLAGVTPWMEKHPTLKVEMSIWRAGR